MAAGRLRQLRLLLWKNWLFNLRSWKSTLLQLLAPLFFLVLVTALSFLPQGLPDILSPPIKSVGHLPKCHPWNGQSCISLRAVNGDFTGGDVAKKCVSDLLHGVSNVTGLDYDKDIELVNFTSHTNITNKIINDLKKMNYTQVAVVFLKCNPSTTEPKLNYTILYNSSRALIFQQLVFGSPDKPDGRVELALMLDSLFMGLVTGKTVKLSLNTTTFPQFFQQESVEAKQATSATLFLFCAITFQFVMMMYNVVSEKDLKLRQGLKLIGLKDSVYWISWAITGIIIAFLSTCVLLVSGYACQLKFFLNTAFYINFLLFFLYSSSMIPLAFFTSVFITTVRQAVNTGMVIFVVGMMVIMLISNPFIMTQLYENVPPLVAVLSFLPPFHLAKAMADIGIAGSETDVNGLPQTPHFYDWSDLFVERKVRTFNFNFKPGESPTTGFFDLPPTYLTLVHLSWNALLYGVLAWYLDAVLHGNHGIPRKWYFFVQPSYWCDCFDRRRDDLNQPAPRSPSSPIQANDDEEEDASNETTALLHGTTNYGAHNGHGLRIDQLVKAFSPGGCCSCCKSPGRPAVDGLSLNVDEHQILALLGHNGAGKTTTINMLIGLLKPDEGDAHFYNFSVRKDLDILRSVLGVCPQHDILWGDLTAKEHMKLFAHLKDIPSEEMEVEVNSLLEEVKLSKVANQRVSTYSGGMKRRLSVALSFLGDPKVLFLDEPTTGMDPKIRRDIWNLILRSKKNRVTIMTTHSMEEADILGDTIAIMANGKLKAMGTSVNLKNTYAGYSIDLIVRHECVSEITKLVQTQIPDVTQKSDPVEVEGGTLLTFGLPPNRNDAIVPLFKRIEEDPNIGRMVVDYSISQTTLEEVFLNVTVNELFQDAAYTPQQLHSRSLLASSKGSAVNYEPPPKNDLEAKEEYVIT